MSAAGTDKVPAAGFFVCAAKPAAWASIGQEPDQLIGVAQTVGKHTGHAPVEGECGLR